MQYITRNEQECGSSPLVATLFFTDLQAKRRSPRNSGAIVLSRIGRIHCPPQTSRRTLEEAKQERDRLALPSASV
jgi:hypothetical protein